MDLEGYDLIEGMTFIKIQINIDMYMFCWYSSK